MDILFYIANKYSSAKPGNQNHDFYHKDALNLLKEYIQDNLEDKLLLGELSKVSAISPFHLLRVFTKHTGSPYTSLSWCEELKKQNTF